MVKAKYCDANEHKFVNLTTLADEAADLVCFVCANCGMERKIRGVYLEPLGDHESNPFPPPTPPK